MERIFFYTDVRDLASIFFLHHEGKMQAYPNKKCANLILSPSKWTFEHQTTSRNIAWMQIFKIFSWKKTLKLQDGVFPSRASV